MYNAGGMSRVFGMAHWTTLLVLFLILFYFRHEIGRRNTMVLVFVLIAVFFLHSSMWQTVM